MEKNGALGVARHTWVFMSQILREQMFAVVSHLQGFRFRVWGFRVWGKYTV